ncbi:hypothetical protein [Crossiella sp. CA198]|uniref:hypothetical protein n=1 Tax=Crossiella sp. CA198 TaxID=3455607 RepID=UPI003F8D48A6
MSIEARLHIKASIWGETDNRIAVLLAEGETSRSTDGQGLLTSAALAAGLRTVTDLNRLFLPTPAGWRVHLDRADLLTVVWPAKRSLVAAAPIVLPGPWRWAANRTGRVVLLIGTGLRLARTAESRETDITVDLARIAEKGNLVGGAVRFAEVASP